MRISETRKRSGAKAISTVLISVMVDFILIRTFWTFMVANPILAAWLIPLSFEMMCVAVHYVMERLWNKVSWGRNVQGV